MKSGKWDARICRANELAAKHSFAAEALRFYTRIAQFQKSLYSELEKECGSAMEFRPLGTLRQELDLFLLLPRFAPFLALVEQHAPAALAESARELRSLGTALWQVALETFWRSGTEKASNDAASSEPLNAHALLAWIFLQAYAEYLADHSDHPPMHGAPHVCPLCSSKPQVGVLRPEGDGGKRLLICSLCATEWDYRRILCPSCGEEDVNKLAVYTADGFGHVRVEACDACRRYIKTVDLTKDGHAIPAVDELATIPLNLWASQHEYEKLQVNILGI
jgi:FdhE protein